MDINAITGALIEALDRYSEIQNIDRYRNLPESAREENIAGEVSRDIGILLAAQPEFGADGVAGTGYADVLFAPALVRVGLSRGATAAIEWLQKILSTRKARGFEIQALYGIRVASATSLVDDIKLVPLDELPDSCQKQGLLEGPSLSPFHNPPFYAYTTPGAALIGRVEKKLIFVNSNTAETQHPNGRVNCEARFKDIRHCLAISHGEPIVSGPSWFQYEDSDYEAAAFPRGVVSHPYHEIVPLAIIEQGEMDLRQAAKIVREYYALDKVLGGRYVQRWNGCTWHSFEAHQKIRPWNCQSPLKHYSIDSFGEHTFKISLRAALLTAEDIITRADNRAIIQAAYTLRSILMHGGQSKNEVTVSGKGKVPSRTLRREQQQLPLM